jgi:hypothetical protein
MLVRVQTERRRDLRGEVRELPDLLYVDTITVDCVTCALATDTLPVASRILVLLPLIVVRGPSGVMSPSLVVLAVTMVTVELLKMAGRTVMTS